MSLNSQLSPRRLSRVDEMLESERIKLSQVDEMCRLAANFYRNRTKRTMRTKIRENLRSSQAEEVLSA